MPHRRDHIDDIAKDISADNAALRKLRGRSFSQFARGRGAKEPRISEDLGIDLFSEFAAGGERDPFQPPVPSVSAAVTARRPFPQPFEQRPEPRVVDRFQPEPPQVSGRVTAPFTPELSQQIREQTRPQRVELAITEARAAGETFFTDPDTQVPTRIVEEGERRTALESISAARVRERAQESDNPLVRFAAGASGTVAGLSPADLTGIVAILWSVGAAVKTFTAFRRLPEFKVFDKFAKENNIPKSSPRYQEAVGWLRTAFNMRKGGAIEASDDIMAQFYTQAARAGIIGAPKGVPPVAPAPVSAITPALVSGRGLAVPRGTQTGALAFGGLPKDPLPANPTQVGAQIAQQLGLVFNGVQEGIADVPSTMLFTDTGGTGTTFSANSLDEATTRLAETREQFAVQPTPEAVEPTISPVPGEGAPTAQVEAIQQQGRTSPETVPPEQAEFSHRELAAPDGPKSPVPPTGDVAQREPEDIISEIASKAIQGERPDQTLLRLHEAAIGNEARRSNLAVRAGNDKLKSQGIGTTRRGELIPRTQDIPKLDELYVALHDPSGVAAGTTKISEGMEEIYNELRALTDWEQAARLDFDPEMATVNDYFYRGWKPPEGFGTNVQQGRPLVRTPSFQKVRANATYQEMRDAGFEPLFWNPYQQWALSRTQGVKFREQMELVGMLKGMGEEFIRPHDGGPVLKEWRVPEIGPAFEGKPFAMENPDTGALMVRFSRRWIVPDNIANSLENIYGKPPSLEKLRIFGRTIDPLKLIDAVTFVPKRAKLVGSFFQQVDFLTRSGAGSWSNAVDKLLAGQPIDAAFSVVRWPRTAVQIIQANFSPSKRLSLAKQLDSTTPLVEGRPGINLKGISEAGLSTRDVTIFPADMDKLVREIATETGLVGKLKAVPDFVLSLESVMRRGLFDGVYPAAIITDITNNIAPMVARQHPSLNDAQINGMIARIANIKYSTIPPSQSIIQNRVIRETFKRLFFSMGESEGLLTQAAQVFKGPNKRFWAKHFVGVYLFLIVAANIIHFASTGEPLPLDRYSPIAKDKWGPLPFGYNTKFAAPTIPLEGRGGAEVTLDLVGQMDTALRLLDPANFISSRESVPVRAAVNQISGTDFFGAPIDDVGPGGIISRTSQLLFDLFAPIGLGGIGAELLRRTTPALEEIVPRGEERLGLQGLAVQALGVNLRTETTGNLLDRFAAESGLTKADGSPVQTWADLEPFQKRDLSNNEQLQTELGLRSEASVERQQLGALGFATLDDIDKERITFGEGLVVEFFNEQMTDDEFRKEVSLLKARMSARKSQVDIDFQLFQETNQLPTDPLKRALVEYYNTFELSTSKESGRLDFDKQEAIEKHFRTTRWTDAQSDYVDRNTGLTEWGPLMAEYQKALNLLEPYFEVPKGSNQRDVRDQMRKDEPAIDAALVRWFGNKPILQQTGTPRPGGFSSFAEGR